MKKGAETAPFNAKARCAYCLAGARAETGLLPGTGFTGTLGAATGLGAACTGFTATGAAGVVTVAPPRTVGGVLVTTGATGAATGLEADGAGFTATGAAVGATAAALLPTETD
jgi:hypothetical protein